MLFATATSDLVKAGEKKARKKALRLEANAIVDAMILVRRDEYAVVAVESTIAVLQVASFFSPSSCSSLELEAGQMHACRVAGMFSKTRLTSRCSS